MGVVAQARALPRDAGAERSTDRLREPRELVGVERAGLAQRVQLRAPQRLVDVDVPQPRDGALVEQRRLERGTAVRQSLAESFRREATLEGLDAEAPPATPIVLETIG